MNDHYERGPYKRYLMDDDAEIPESTLRRRRLLETAQKESLQAEKHANNEDVWHADESLSSNTDNLLSDSTDTSDNKESDRSSTDDRCTDQTPDISSGESFDHADVTDPERNEESLLID